MKPRNRKAGVLISNSQRAVRVDRERLACLVRFVARAEGHRLGQLDLAVVGKGEIAGLNRRWLAHGGATDVLSFDLSEAGASPARGGRGHAKRGARPGAGGGICAQLVVCGEVAREQARLRGLPAQRELMLYVVHGLLHLMDYEDETIHGAAKMHAREEELLRAFLVPRRPRGVRPRFPQSAIRNPKSEMRGGRL